MHWGVILRVVIVAVALLAAAGLGYLVARRWRKEYRQAVANRAEYHELKAALTSDVAATASVSGHVVIVQQGANHDDNDDNDAAVRLLSLIRNSGLVAPGELESDVLGALRAGDNRGGLDRVEALTSGRRILSERMGVGGDRLASGRDVGADNADAGGGDVA